MKRRRLFAEVETPEKGSTRKAGSDETSLSYGVEVMALELNFWEADAPNGETLHHSVRIKRIEAKHEILREFLSGMSQGSIVRVTLDRSDNQSSWSRDEWIKPGYVDPFGD